MQRAFSTKPAFLFLLLTFTDVISIYSIASLLTMPPSPFMVPRGGGGREVSVKIIAVPIFKASSTTLLCPKKRFFFLKFLPLPASLLKILLFT